LLSFWLKGLGGKK